MTAPLVRVARTPELSAARLASARALMDAAFDGDFSDDDWAHACGGWHAFLEEGSDVIAHASVVPRVLTVGDRAVRAGYVEAVAVMPARQRRGLGSAVMQALHTVIRRDFEAGALSTGEWPFYESLGWARWQGPSFVRETSGALTRTEDDDDGLMVLDGWADDPLDRTAPIVCEARAGDAW